MDDDDEEEEDDSMPSQGRRKQFQLKTVDLPNDISGFKVRLLLNVA